MPKNKPDEFNEKNRMIFFTGDFKEKHSQPIIERLIQYENIDPNKPIIMWISSYGGYVDEFLAIHDTIKMLSCPVATVCIGKAMSCGQMLLMSGEPGLRFCTTNARIFVHDMEYGDHGNVEHMKISHEEHLRLEKLMGKMIKNYCKIDNKKLETLMNREIYLTAKEARGIGMIDHVLTSTKSLYRKLKIK